MHLKVAITQRRTWSSFVKEYLKRVDPNTEIPGNVIPLMLDNDSILSEERVAVDEALGVQLLVDDFGGDLTLPFYGFRRPSAD